MSTSDEQVTEMIMEALDEVAPGSVATHEASTETAQPDATTPGEEESDDEAVSVEEDEAEEAEEGDEAPDDEDESEEEQADEESGDEEAEPATSFSDDPEVQGFVARHGGDPEAALKKAVNFERHVSRQGRELGVLRERNEELERELERAHLFASDGPDFLNEEQREWVEEAALSGEAMSYITGAVDAGEFGLARAVLEQADFTAGQALRIAQGIDRAETLAQPVEQAQQPLAHNVLMEVLVEHFPDMPKYEAEMVSTVQALGEDHPLVGLAQSQDHRQAVQGIIGIYEIARAKTATVSSTREEVKRKSREAAAAVREKAVVSSGSATPPHAQNPRQTTLMPGLTVEALEAELDAASR